MTIGALGDDRLVPLLLSSSLARRPRDEPALLGASGWAQVAAALKGAEMSPSALLGMSAADMVTALGFSVEQSYRVTALLRRAGPIAIEIERLSDRGIWAMTQLDDDYPPHLRDALGPAAPPVLFGAGERRTLSAVGLAIVGSRDAPQDAVDFAMTLAQAAAAGGTVVVSGAARGIDIMAMEAALANNGVVIGVLADQLEKRVRDPSMRVAIGEDRLTLVTPLGPTAGFSVRSAMGRNKVIYGLARAAVVVAVKPKAGGTWAGAAEALRAGHVPVFTRAAASDGGSDALQELGARRLPFASIPDRILPEDVDGWTSPDGSEPRSAPASQTLLFDAEEQPVAPRGRRRKR